MQKVFSIRIVAFKTIRDFYHLHPTSKTALENWYKTSKAAQWKGLNDIKKDMNSVDYVGNKRYVFNIKGNDFRMVVKILFTPQILYIRFIGTHKEYDKIDCKTV